MHNKLNQTRNEIIEELNKLQSTIDFISSPTTISNEMGFVQLLHLTNQLL